MYTYSSITTSSEISFTGSGMETVALKMKYKILKIKLKHEIKQKRVLIV